ncbi:MAG: hypothetical protein RL701_8105 [Pseudomonadota bacterium]
MKAFIPAFSVVCCLWAFSVSFSAPARAFDSPTPSPFEPLSAAEQRSAFEVVNAHFRDDASLPHSGLFFPLVALAEPPKASVLALKAGQRLPRRAELQIMHHPQNRTWVALVDLASKRLLQLTPVMGQPALAGSEYEEAGKLVRAHEPWQKALRARGIDPANAYLDTWAGNAVMFSNEALGHASHGRQTRLVHCLTFLSHAPNAKPESGPNNPYDRPVEGLVVTVDMNARQVIDFIDRGAQPVSTETGNAAKSQPLKPLHVVEPQGSELSVSGQLVTYRNWQFYAALHPREGLVLYDVRYRDHGRWRRIAYRLALSEIYVPYGIGDPNWAFRAAFDVGEYNAGIQAQTLELGRDVPNNAHLLDATFFSDLGPTPENPNGTHVVPAALAIYERAVGLIWTRTDPRTRFRDSREAREVVATWSAWLGNYIYNFEWIFKLDGSIEMRALLHGTTLNRGTNSAREPSAPKIGKDAKGTFVSAPHHQHFLNFRLDLDIDGEKNQLMEMEVTQLRNPAFKNAFDTQTQNLTLEGYRDVEPLHARHWHVESSTAKNPFGKPTSYALEPETLAFPYSAPDYEGLQRAAFALHALWFTRHRDNERYAAGEFPYQATATDGVTTFITPAEALRGQDIVLWYTTGFTHIARPEDYPVMPVETVSFKLQPRGFFDQNPALEVGVTPKQ